MDVIAVKPNEYYCLCPPVFKRKRTEGCIRDALDMLESYMDFRMIDEKDYKEAKREIQKAPHDDAISNIMTKVRKKAKW